MNQLTPMPATNAQFPRSAYEHGAFDPAIDDERWVTFSDLFRIVRVNWKMILATGVATMSAGALVVSLMTPLYLGSALVMVDEQQSHVLNDQTNPSVLSDLPSDPSSIESQVQMLQSHVLAGQVVDKLNLVNDPEFNGRKFDLIGTALGLVPRLVNMIGFGKTETDQRLNGLTPAQKLRERTIGKFLGGLNVQAVGRSTVIEVDFRSESAEKAARIANVIAKTYIDNLEMAKSDASEGASKWLADRVTQLGREAGAADAAVQQYKAENGLVDTSTGTAMTDQQLGDLTSQLILAQGNEAEAQARLARVQDLVRSGHSADVTEVVDSPLIGQLREQEATLLQQKADLSSRYGPLHPKMQDIEAQLRELNRKISEEVNRVVGTVSNNVAVAAAHVGALKSDMARVTSSTNTQNQARVKLGELEANAASAHAVYQTYLDRLKQTEQQESLKIPDVHVASPASVPLGPVSPKKVMIIGGAALGGLLIGFILALIADRACTGFRSASELERALGLSVLATVPEIGARHRPPGDVGMEVIRRPHSQYSEAIRGLEIGLSLHGTGHGTGKVILVTSALPSEGKTMTSVNLARQLAVDGHRVVIIDGDLRRPKVATALGLHLAKYGLVDYLARRCSLDDAMTADAHSPLVAVTASHTTDPVGYIRSPGMASLVTRLRDLADFVIIDSPPVLAVHDAKLLAQLSDGALFVVRWEKTSKDAATIAVKALRDFGVPLSGAALVRANAQHHEYYAYGYAGVPTLAKYYEG